MTEATHGGSGRGMAAVGEQGVRFEVCFEGMADSTSYMLALGL